MKRLPESLLQSLEGVPGFEREAFEKAHESGIVLTSIRINPHKLKNGVEELASGFREMKIEAADFFHHPVSWSSYGYYLDKRPSFTFDPLFHAGCYYVQEASSMFLEQAFLQLTDHSRPLKVLDLCGAPGGKSTHIQSLIHPESLLVSNEVIRSRSNILADNILKWGAENVIVTNNDPAAFRQLEGYFDVLVVDAPCSGSGLFRKDEEAISEWSPNNVQLCHQRQQRILADVLPALREDGLLIYSTCSYSKDEDEDIADWLVEEWDMHPEKLITEPSWNIVETATRKGAWSYRFYPYKLEGEGFFLSCFRKTRETTDFKWKPARPEKLSSMEKSAIEPWVNAEGMELIKEQENFYALTTGLLDDYARLRKILNIRYTGVALGQVMKERLVPHHALALSLRVKENIPFNELDYPEAVKYLQRQDISLSPAGKGWQLVCYKNHNLGWINALQNRINNYYPKELRILKQTITSFEK